MSDPFFSPLREALPHLSTRRTCPSLTDRAWLEAGILRALSHCKSGRDFLAQLAFSNLPEITRTHFFETLRSKRRLQLCKEAAKAIHQYLVSTHADRLCEIDSLKDFEVFAGDGHWHSAAAHDQQKDAKKHAVGHLYGLDLRHNALFHLQMSDAEKKKKEHDMTALKRTDIENLRCNAPKGRKVLWIWDRAGIDFRQWYQWKQGSGVYFLSRTKKNMRLETLAKYPWDTADAINRGVLSDEQVSTSQGVSVRKVAYRDPATGQELAFLTNLPTTVAAGALAQLYRMRWDVEKVFDELKNKLGEKKGWASSPTAKAMQAAFLSMTYNLIEAVSLVLQQQHNISNKAETKRKAKRLKQEIKKAPQPLPELYLKLQRFTQHSVKLIRWLRYHLWNNSSLIAALPQLRTLYSRL